MVKFEERRKVFIFGRRVRVQWVWRRLFREVKSFGECL